MKLKHDELVQALKDLRLYTVSREYVEAAKNAEQEKFTYEQYLANLIKLEQSHRQNNRIKKLTKDAKIPLAKSLESYNFKIRTGITENQFNRLATGEFLRQGGNLVFYGSFGVGKSHLAVSLTQKLCELGYRCFFSSTSALINQLLVAKRDLELNTLLKRLDRFDLLVCDELGYLPQNQEGADLFFQLISQRAERRSLLITTNLIYSEWDKVFINPLSTAAAVDRIIHNCQTFNIGGESYRSIIAKKRTELLTEHQEETIQ